MVFLSQKVIPHLDTNSVSNSFGLVLANAKIFVLLLKQPTLPTTGKLTSLLSSLHSLALNIGTGSTFW